MKGHMIPAGERTGLSDFLPGSIDNRRVLLKVLHFFGRRLDIERFLRVLVLTFAVSLAVTGVGAYYGGTPVLPDVLWQSCIIALLVAACTGWTKAREPEYRTSAAPANDESGNQPAESAGSSDSVKDIEERGITIKLLELIALGDRYGNVFSVALISVDHLDALSEHYGAEVTTRLLERVTSTLTQTLRMPDRVGEVERGAYLVVLPETKLPGAVQIAERLRTAISRLDVAVSERVHINTTASLGVTSFRRGDDLQGLLDRARKALREAEKQGHNRVLPDLAA